MYCYDINKLQQYLCWNKITQFCEMACLQADVKEISLE